MISVKFWIISLFIFLTIISVSPYPNPTKRKTGDIASCTLPDVNNINTVSGGLHFYEVSEKKLNVTGQFNSGFPNAHPDNYEYAIIDKDDKVVKEMTDSFRNIEIKVPGTAPFTFIYDGLSVDDIKDHFFIIRRRSYVEA
ncbi:24412_t:CDS:1, partial [Gigaspora margarita]